MQNTQIEVTANDTQREIISEEDLSTISFYAKKYKVKAVYLFGSMLDNMNQANDIELDIDKLKEKYLKLVEACIRRSASLHSITIIEISVMPEHVHIIVQISMNLAPSKALQILKGGSARLFFKHHEKARLRYPKGHLWSRGKFAASLGFVQIEVVNEYVRNQDKHHGTVWTD